MSGLRWSVLARDSLCVLFIFELGAPFLMSLREQIAVGIDKLRNLFTSWVGGPTKSLERAAAFKDSLALVQAAPGEWNSGISMDLFCTSIVGKMW